MGYKIDKVAVLGAGVMGSGIAALLASLGYDVLLLDIVPFGEPSEKEIAKGITKDSKAWRNKLSEAGLKGALKAKPAAFYTKGDASRVTTGNFDDDFEKIADCDWVIEVVIERLDIKKQVFEKVEKYRKPGCIVSTNTSGLSIHAMTEGRSDEFCEHFLGTHFFNPPRYLRLLEIVPHEKTKPEVLDFMKWFCTERLGKGVIIAKDTPNFVANRIGVHGMMYVMSLVERGEFSIPEVDTVMGKPMGRPKTASFKTADLVGLDTLYHVAKTVYDTVPDDEERDVFSPPKYLEDMIEKKWLGNKTKGGFYKKEKVEGETKRYVLDVSKMEYVPLEKIRFDSIGQAKKISDLGERVKFIVNAEDKAGQLAWKVTARSLAYTSRRIPEIADDIVTVDRAMKWGFNFEAGPFEGWDAIGVRESVERMEADGLVVADWVKEMLDKGFETFYTEKDGSTYYYDLNKKDYVKLEEDPKAIKLETLRKKNKVVWENDEATLYDMGDGVLCLEFHNEFMNAIGPDIIEGMNEAAELLETEDKWVGLVIGNESPAFSAGANVGIILMAINSEQWDQVEGIVKQFQDVNMRLKYGPKPVVAALAGIAVGGGCEITMHANRVVANPESYIGLVELGVGVIPAGGGTKEMVLRQVEHLLPDFNGDLLPFAGKAFENIAMAKVATSAKEAVDFGILRKSDRLVPNRDYLLYEAKQAVLGLIKEGYEPGKPKTDIPVAGEYAWGAFALFAQQQSEAGYVTEYEVFMAKQLAKVISGGAVREGTKVSEQYLLDLEREIFVLLCQQEKTKERIMHFVMNKKPLRN